VFVFTNIASWLRSPNFFHKCVSFSFDDAKLQQDVAKLWQHVGQNNKKMHFLGVKMHFFEAIGYRL